MAIIKEFKEFAMRGNVIDMAVGVVIGAAFGKIISSLVDDIIMPLVGVATGGINFTDYKWVIQQAVIDGSTQEVLKAFCIFIAIKAINQLKRKEAEPEPAPEAPAEPTKEEVLLTEIRDLLKEKK